jgi:glycine cleavage system H lipoate-binding protein
VIKNPQLINKDPYIHWVVRIKPTKLEEEISSSDIINIGDQEELKRYIYSELEKYEEEID